MKEDNEIKEKYNDKTLPMTERRADYAIKMDKMMNPVPTSQFDPETVSTLDDDLFQVSNRQRIIPPKQLPTFGIKPKEIREGQMIGMYESKQDLYLLFAHRCNDLQIEVDELKQLISDLQTIIDKK